MTDPERKPSTDLDLLMDLDPLELSNQQIDEVIAYLRKQRLAVEYGVRPKKAGKEVTDLSKVLTALTMQAPADPIKRRL